jgi:hypothetical protein
MFAAQERFRWDHPFPRTGCNLDCASQYIRLAPKTRGLRREVATIENEVRLGGLSRRFLENKEIARVLWETADLMEIAGEDSFRIRSYRNGATAIEGYPERVADILRDPERKVTDIPGIGKGLAAW